MKRYALILTFGALLASTVSVAASRTVTVVDDVSKSAMVSLDTVSYIDVVEATPFTGYEAVTVEPLIVDYFKAKVESEPSAKAADQTFVKRKFYVLTGQRKFT